MSKDKFDMYRWRTNVWLREANDFKDTNDESEMAHGQLMSAIDSCEKLASMIKPGMQLDAWVQSKLTLASEYLESVAVYMASQENK
jgi:hypothetical protein